MIRRAREGAVCTLGLLLVFFVLSAGCASGGARPPAGETTGWTLPEVAQIATPETAEKALYTAVKAYEFTMGTINRAHAAGKMTDARHEELAKLGDRFRVFAVIAWNATQTWRATGDREPFVAAYVELKLAGAKLADGGGGAR